MKPWKFPDKWWRYCSLNYKNKFIIQRSNEMWIDFCTVCSIYFTTIFRFFFFTSILWKWGAFNSKCNYVWIQTSENKREKRAKKLHYSIKLYKPYNLNAKRKSKTYSIWKFESTVIQLNIRSLVISQLYILWYFSAYWLTMVFQRTKVHYINSSSTSLPI